MNNSNEHSIDSAQKEDILNFERLFRAYYTRLCIYACSYVHQSDDAEDVVKEIFLKIWKDRDKIAIKTTQAGYLYAAVRNQCINFIQRKQSKKQNIVSLTELQPVAYEKNDITDYMVAAELQERITILVEMLPMQCREIFKMNRYDGMSYEQIAEILNISKGTIKTQIFRALDKIRVGLAGYL